MELYMLQNPRLRYIGCLPRFLISALNNPMNFYESFMCIPYHQSMQIHEGIEEL